MPLQNVSLALAELERCVKQLGLRGVEINPSVNGMDLTDALGQDREVVLGLGPPSEVMALFSSISRAIGTKDYLRARVGIGRPPGRIYDSTDFRGYHFVMLDSVAGSSTAACTKADWSEFVS